MTLRFEEGEIAVTRTPSYEYLTGELERGPGCEVEVINVGPFRNAATGYCFDYVIRFDDGVHGYAMDWELRKRRPPIPDEVRELFDVEPVDKGVPA